jgi:hypothetical protein
MLNRNVTIEMWDIEKLYRYRANKAVESWNYKLNGFIGKKKQTNVFLQVQKMKRRSRDGILSTEIKGTWTAWPITKKDLCKKKKEKIKQLHKNAIKEIICTRLKTFSYIIVNNYK